MRARTQFAVAATAVAALLVALTGQLLVSRLDDRDRADIDRALAARAQQVSAEATKTGKLPTDGVYAVRLMSGTQVRAQSGSTVQFSAPVRDGYSTVEAADGREYRSWAETLKTGVQLQVLTSLTDVQARHGEAVRLVDLSVLAAILLGGLASWFAGGILLRPLRRLQEGAGELRPDDLSGRLPGVSEPREVAEVVASVNALLDRMQAAAETNPAALALPAALPSGPAALPSGPAALPLGAAALPLGPAAASPAGSPAPLPPGSPLALPPGAPAVPPGAPAALPAGASAAPPSGPLGGLPLALRAGLPAVSTVTPPPAVPDTFPPRAMRARPAVAAQNGAGPSPTHQGGAGRNGADRNGADRNGADRNGVDRNGVDRDEIVRDDLADRDEEALRDALGKLGDDLDTLLDNPELSPTQRHLILASIQNEYRRIVLLMGVSDTV